MHRRIIGFMLASVLLVLAGCGGGGGGGGGGNQSGAQVSTLKWGEGSWGNARWGRK